MVREAVQTAKKHMTRYSSGNCRLEGHCYTPTKMARRFGALPTLLPPLPFLGMEQPEAGSRAGQAGVWLGVLGTALAQVGVRVCGGELIQPSMH